jgi:hypothetical protein
MYRFILTGSDKGQTKVLLDKYQFVDGVMDIEGQGIAEKLQKILCRYYGVTCELVVAVVEKTEKTEAAKKTSLAKADTKSAE